MRLPAKGDLVGGAEPMLRGAYSAWTPGPNEAECKQLACGVPHRDWRTKCGCGFWAYWLPSYVDSGQWHVLGVVRAWGPTLLGPRGFRAKYAEITGLHVKPELTLRAWGNFARGGLVPAQPKSPTRPIMGPPDPYYPDPVLLTLIEEALRVQYRVPVYATSAMMLLDHPLTTGYVKEEHRHGECRNCLEPLTAEGICPLHCQHMVTSVTYDLMRGPQVLQAGELIIPAHLVNRKMMQLEQHLGRRMWTTEVTALGTLDDDTYRIRWQWEG